MASRFPTLHAPIYDTGKLSNLYVDGVVLSQVLIEAHVHLDGDKAMVSAYTDLGVIPMAQPSQDTPLNLADMRERAQAAVRRMTIRPTNTKHVSICLPKFAAIKENYRGNMHLS